MPSRFRKVTPHQMVEVHHNNLWLGGELEAWWMDDGQWLGLVTFYVPGGGLVHKWFHRVDIMALGDRAVVESGWP